MHSHKRRNYLVNKTVQVKYAILIIVMLVIYTVLVLAAIFLPQINIFLSQTLPLPEKAEAANAFLLINSYVWPAIAVIIVLFGALSILITHRLAGPLFVIQRMIVRLGEGDLTARIRIRRGDDLREFEHLLNSMAEKQELLLSVLDERFNNIASHARELPHGNSAAVAAKITAETEAIGKILEHCTLSRKKQD